MRFKMILDKRDEILVEELYKRGIGSGKMRDILGVHPYVANRFIHTLGYRRSKIEQVGSFKKHFGKTSHHKTFTIPEILSKFPEIKERLAQCA